MEWLKKLEDYNISFHIHLLEKEDFIIIKKEYEEKRIMYILDGLAQLMKVFSNNEKVCVELLQNCQITTTYHSSSRRNNHYNILTAITVTKIITVSAQEIKTIQATDKTSRFTGNVVRQHNKNNEITSILSHRNTQKRIVQLLIILAKKFGRVKGSVIAIPFHLSHQTIADITGSQRGTVGKIMSKLKKNKNIGYGSKSIMIRNLKHLIQD